MKYENITLEINSKKAAGISKDLLKLEVECDDQLASMFKLRLPMKPKGKGTLTYLDDKRFALWNQVSISVGFGLKTHPLVYGYITHLKPHIDPDPTQCVLEVWGMDKSILMDRKEVLKDWPNKKDSDIAREILVKYGFVPKVDDTKVVHDEKVSTIVQRETDMTFLKRLAQRNGFRCYVEDKTAYFRKYQLKQDRDAVLAFKFGEESVLRRFSVSANGLTPTSVLMYQVDRLSKKVLDVSVKTSGEKLLGTMGPGTFHPPGTPKPRIYVSMNAATGKPEMEALCKGMVQEAEWFVSAEGEVAGNKFGNVLKPGTIVIISGVGATYSGYYYVSHVTHSFTDEGYVQHFKVKRNALVPRGVGMLTSIKVT